MVKEMKRFGFGYYHYSGINSLSMLFYLSFTIKIQPKSLYTGFYSDLNGLKLKAVSTLNGSNSVLHIWSKTPVNSYEYNTKKC